MLIDSPKSQNEMKLNQSFFQFFEQKAGRVTIESLSIGLGYTLVVTSDGGLGLSYSYFDAKNTCMLNRGYEDPEGSPALVLLEKIFSHDPLQRSLALATINALNHESIATLAEEQSNQDLLAALNIKEGTRVAMVGFFRPLLALFKKQRALVEVLDEGKNLGEKEAFYQKIGSWAQVLILTSTTILNNTTEEILGYCPPNIKTVLLGPSTPLVKEPLAHLPIHLLAGTLPLDKEQILKAVRHGTGTPIIQKFGRKILLDITSAKS